MNLWGSLRATLAVVAAIVCVPATACTAASDDDTDGSESDFTAGQTLVLRGTVVTMDEARGDADVIEDGAVVVKDGKIDRVLAAGEPMPAGAFILPSRTGKSDWVITPGLVNLHNHLAYNTAHIYHGLPLYQNTYQWRDEAYYDTHIQYPKRIFGDSTYQNDVDFAGVVGRYSEIKELVSGTTSTQGAYFGPQIPDGYGKDLVRNVDTTTFGEKRVSQASLGILVGTFDPREVVAKMEAGKLDAWLVHLLEGTDQVSRDEFDCLRAMGLVRKELVIIHGIALSDDQLAEMAKAGSKLVTSPLDNLLYYGQTPNIVKAHQLGVNVSLGTDWSPAGSKNLLFELKVLDQLNQQAFAKAFTDRDMMKMVTANPADAIGWTTKVGRLKAGLYADIAVYKKKPGTAYRSVIDATEADVELVMVGGDPLYGDAHAMRLLKRNDNEPITACGADKAIDVTSNVGSLANVKFDELKHALDQALTFDKDWMLAHYGPAKTDGWTADNEAANMTKAFPRGVEARTLDAPFACEDDTLFDEVRTAPNVRTAFKGLCLDLRPAYGKGTTPDCGQSISRPAQLTVDQHPGTVPERPAAWCAGQDWKSLGDLPKPPK